MKYERDGCVAEACGEGWKWERNGELQSVTFAGSSEKYKEMSTFIKECESSECNYIYVDSEGCCPRQSKNN